VFKGVHDKVVYLIKLSSPRQGKGFTLFIFFIFLDTRIIRKRDGFAVKINVGN